MSRGPTTQCIFGHSYWAIGMTLFLASVTGPDEAEIALALGADIIDLKDAARGGLAPLPHDVVRAAVVAVAGRRSVSAVAGDAGMDPDAVASAVQEMAL